MYFPFAADGCTTVCMVILFGNFCNVRLVGLHDAPISEAIVVCIVPELRHWRTVVSFTQLAS